MLCNHGAVSWSEVETRVSGAPSATRNTNDAGRLLQHKVIRRADHGADWLHRGSPTLSVDRTVAAAHGETLETIKVAARLQGLFPEVPRPRGKLRFLVRGLDGVRYSKS